MQTNEKKGEVKTAIVLSAGGVSPTLRSAYGAISSAMLPVGGRPVIQRSLEYLRQHGFRRVIIGTNPHTERLRKFVSQVFERHFDVHFVQITLERGPGGTLLECLKHNACPDSVTIVLGDTLFEFPQNMEKLNLKNYVLTANDAPDSTRWCYADVSSESKVLELKDKPGINPKNHQILIGVYHTDNKNIGLEALEAYNEGQRLELRHFIEPYIYNQTLFAYPAAEWSDCGNVDLLSGSRRRILKTREFNEIVLDELRGTLTKRSRNKLKLVDEINFYRLLPKDLQCFFPRVLDFSIAPENVFMTLEYYGYPTLSELWTFEEYDPRTWQKIFCRIREVIRCFEDYAMPMPASTIKDFYWNKTIDRVDAFKNQSDIFSQLVRSKSLYINDVEMLGWPKIKEWVHDRIKSISKNCKPQITHGDLCFANILYDPLSQALKLIDVRGSFGSNGLYGDPRYDVAKLLHSIDGGYDLIIHDMFNVVQNGTRINIEQFFPATKNDVISAFTECFEDDFNMNDVRFIEGLLFISMCPLHKDNPERQVAMFAIGIEIISRLML
jgi:dTDP-glucose pyrophosphorylase